MQTVTLLGIRTETLEQVEIFELAPRHSVLVKPIGQTVAVIGGMAWVTLNGEDIVVCGGESIELTPSKHEVALSALGGKSVVFEIH
jgi:hypothetical protein